jgi:hypothetical protein
MKLVINRTPAISILETIRKPVLDRMERTKWEFASPAVPAIFELWRRVVDAAARNRAITYRAWLKDVVIEAPLLSGGRPYKIGPELWTSLDQRLAEDLAKFMSARSYFECNALIGSFLVDVRAKQPAPSLFTWAESVGAAGMMSENRKDEYWIEQLRKCHGHYKQ